MVNAFGRTAANAEYDPDEIALNVEITPLSLLFGEPMLARSKAEIELEAEALVEIERSDAVIRRILQPKPDGTRGSRAYLDSLIKKTRREFAAPLKLDEKSGPREELRIYAETLRPKDAVAFGKFLVRTGR